MVNNNKPPEFRGIFGDKGDSESWLEEVERFPNGVPRFSSKEECLEFMESYGSSNGGSNPDYPQLLHIFTMLISWEQIEKHLLPNIEKARKEPSSAAKIPRDYLNDPIPDSNNVYEREEASEVLDEVIFRLQLPIHRCMTPVSVMNTMKYLFFHMKCGIYVMIRDNKLRIFSPFVNKDYRNTWGDKLTVEGDGSLDAYYKEKSKYYRREFVEKDRSKWWANGNIICNELTKEKDKRNMQFWGDHFLAALRDMLGEVCNQREMPDCEFFLNKRDYPQLKFNVERRVPVEPYGFIFDKDDRSPDEDVDLVEEHKFTTYAPIVSFYAAAPDRFSDVPWPSSEDWEAACGEVFPSSLIHRRNREGNIEFNGKPRDLFTEENFRKFERTWEDNRIATAFFRGTATGGGTTIENNQRVKCAYLCNLWKDDPEKGGEEEPFLDAQIVGWNLRDKKIAEGPMTFLRPKNFDFTAGKHHFTPIYEQSKYKYLVYIDGHCAACRYGFMMRLGSVILKVAPRQVADRMWYFPLLKPYHDHIPVEADLSDLEEKIRWCRANDAKCKEIGQNALAFYEKYVAKDALLDYVQMAVRCMAKRYIQPPSWWEAPPPSQPPPKLRKPHDKCYHDKATRRSRLCVRCQEEKDEEDRDVANNEARMIAERKNRRMKKTNYRDRMKKKAKMNNS